MASTNTAFIQPLATASSFSSPCLRHSSFVQLAPSTASVHVPRRVRSPLIRRPVSASSEKSDSEPEQPSQPVRPKKPEQTFFGLRLRTNGDVIKFGIIATIIPFGIKAALQAGGVPDLLAGQMTTGFVSVFALLAWISTYVFRVGTKQMTYAQQLREYEDQVIQKRYEELTEEELAALTEELKEES